MMVHALPGAIEEGAGAQVPPTAEKRAAGTTIRRTVQIRESDGQLAQQWTERKRAASLQPFIHMAPEAGLEPATP